MDPPPMWRTAGDLAEQGERLEPEAFVKDRPAMPQSGGELEVPLLTELASHVVAQVVVRPVRPTVDGALLVVKLRVEQDQPVNLFGTPGGVVGADTTSEPRPEQADTARPGGVCDLPKGNPGVVEDRRGRQFLLPALALTLAP